jgi:hypothetical protein
MDGFFSDLSRREDFGVRVGGITSVGSRVGGAAFDGLRPQGWRQNGMK